MPRRIIPPLDLLFFLLETPGSPKHVGAVQIFRKPRGAPADYMLNLVKAFKTAPVVPPFNCRPRFPRFGLPEWEVDEGLDIDYHVRHSALPQPGNEEQLVEVLQRLHCGVLSRDRPGWISQIIEGLEGDRFAIYSKVHHAYIDGMSGVKRMYGTLSRAPDDTAIVPTWSLPEASRGKARPTPGNLLGSLSRGMGTQLRAFREVAGSLSRMGVEFVQANPRGAQPLFHAPRTRMNSPVEYDTRAIAFCSLPLDRVRGVGERTGTKVNDVVLSVVDASLHDYLERKGENTRSPLVALCPVSTREEGDDSATTQASVLHIRLGAPGADHRLRLDQVAAAARAAKSEARALSREALLDFSLIMAGALELADRTPLGRFLSPSYNVLVSNVPGPRDDPLYLCGAEQLASFPISTFLPGGNLNVTLLSHGNRIDFGLVADKHALPDVAEVARGIERHFEMLDATVPGPASAGAARGRNRAGRGRTRAKKGRRPAAAAKKAPPAGSAKKKRAAAKPGVTPRRRTRTAPGA